MVRCLRPTFQTSHSSAQFPDLCSTWIRGRWTFSVLSLCTLTPGYYCFWVPMLSSSKLGFVEAHVTSSQASSAHFTDLLLLCLPTLPGSSALLMLQCMNVLFYWNLRDHWVEGSLPPSLLCVNFPEETGPVFTRLNPTAQTLNPVLQPTLKSSFLFMTSNIVSSLLPTFLRHA